MGRFFSPNLMLSWQPLFDRQFFFSECFFPHSFFIDFDYVWAVLVALVVLEKTKESKMPDLRGPPFENMINSLHHNS